MKQQTASDRAKAMVVDVLNGKLDPSSSTSTKYEIYRLPSGELAYVGRAGALRIGKNLATSFSYTDRVPKAAAR